MNGVRTTFMRRGYLLTALSALLLLAASSGTAEAQRVSIGFVETSGMVHEKAFLDANALESPTTVTISVSGLLPGARRVGDISRTLGDVTVTPNRSLWIGMVTSTGDYMTAAETPAAVSAVTAAGTAFTIDGSHFSHSDEVTLVLAQSQAGDPDPNWVNEMVELKLATGVDSSTQGRAPAAVNPDVYTLTVNDSHLAPVAEFEQPDFRLAEQSTRTVELNVASAIPGLPLPGAATTASRGVISVRVSNHHLVMFGDGSAAASSCPARGNPLYNRKLFRIDVGDGWSSSTGGTFNNTALLQTTGDISAIAAAGATADFTIEGCGDGAGIRDPYITLTILETNLAAGPRPTFRAIGDIETGSPLMVSIDSDEAGPTLSFSPTDVTIDEGSSVETVLLAEGPNANDVRAVKLMVEGDAMVDLYQGDEMLEEMNGYVMVDLGGNSSARLTAMSMESRELQDGDMAYKAWKLMDGAAEGVNIGEGYWFRVDVVGSTAVPALPLIGQLLLALFLMAGGSRLYRRRQG